MRELIFRLLYTLFRCLPVSSRKIFFMSYYGSQYGCNPKYLSEHMAASHPELDLVWAFTQPGRHHVAGIRKVRYLSLRFFYELYTSRVLVTNYRMPLFYRRRKGQFYIQTWHSSLRLKAIEADAAATIPQRYVEMARHDSRQISILLSGCQKSTDIFRRAFWYDGEIAPTGTPRLDVLFHHDEGLRRHICSKIGIDSECHVVLYAPTFRENHGLEAYDIDFNALCKALRQRWGGEWVVLLRLHPHLQNMSSDGRLKMCQDVTAYDDPQELLCISDVVVSDYSGLVFDFAYTRKPCFLYVPDLDDYLLHERHLYFNIEELPFPLVRSNGEWSHVVNSFDEQQYHHAVDEFLAQTGTYETGHACENVRRLIEQHLTL